MRRCIHPGWRVLFVVFLALPLRSGPLQAQEISALVPQTRVRVTALIPEVGKLEKMTGTIVSAGADSLVLQVDRGNSRVAMPWGAVRYLDESAGHRSRGSTVALGSLIFAATGAGLGLVLGQDCSTLTVDGESGPPAGGIDARPRRSGRNLCLDVLLKAPPPVPKRQNASLQWSAAGLYLREPGGGMRKRADHPSEQRNISCRS
jgi:hypothetical protein